MKRLFVFYIILVYSLAVSSQSVQVSAPSHVSTGENFRVEYHVSSDNVSDVRLGKVPDGLEEIAGPYVSTQSSYQIVNGHATSNSSARVTYLFYAAKPGTYTIPGAVINVNGKTVSAKSHKVTVSGTAPHNSQQPQSAPRMHQQPQQEDHVAAQASGNDSQSVFIRVTANKNTVVEQEPVTLTYKLYTATQITVPSDLKMPNVQDFTIYEIPQPSSVQWQNESVNGRTYKCVTWKQYVVYPQSTGKLTVPGSSVQINKIVRNAGVDPLEQFLNPGSSYQEIETSVAVPALTVEVVPLPNRPANFSGGVGSFSMNTSISKNCVKAGEPITIQVNLSGTGNMKLVKHPIVSFPKDFEVYDPKVTDNTTNTKQGIQGSVTYDFIAVPQNKGHFTIPPVEFIYYDAATSGYKTLKSQEMKVDVLEGNGNTASESYQEELRNSDIYPIILLQNADYRSDDSFFMSTAYLLVIFSLLIAFVVFLYIFRKRAIERADVVRMKANRANKIASQKLKKAAHLMKANSKDEFYDEVLRALWGYAADKINIPVEELSKDNIKDKLMQRGCNSFSVEKFTEAISECEYARFAPTKDEKSSMNNTFDMAVTAIIEIEEALKTTSKSLATTLIIAALFGLMPANANAATTLETANAAYQAGNYQQAITLYEQVLSAGDCPQVYYNLANAYYRTNQISKAILNYERASLYSPTDAELIHNLELVRTKTQDKFIPAADIFLVKWYKAVVYLTSVYGWAVLSIIILCISLVSLLVYLFTNSLILRKMSFWATFITLIMFLGSIMAALQQNYYIHSNSFAVITVPEAEMKKSPEADGKKILSIHEGTRIEVIDDGMKDWKEIELPDGRTGWVKTAVLTMIKR